VTELAYYRSVVFVPAARPDDGAGAAAAAAALGEPGSPSVGDAAGASRTPEPSERVPD
jgi:hypothetical protein